MTGDQYLILAYVVGLGLLWGYALSLWLAARAAARRDRLATAAQTATQTAAPVAPAGGGES